jgi:hypothetical protein
MNIEHRTSNIEHPTSNIEHRTSNIEHPTLNIEEGEEEGEGLLVICYWGRERELAFLSVIHDPRSAILNPSL